MEKEIHKGVGLIIGNEDQSRFFVQIKDQTYPYPEWRGACAYWGGAIEQEDASEIIAVERELVEELPGAVGLLKEIPKNRIDQFWVENETVVAPFWLTIFEAVVPDSILEQVADSEVLEGDGELLSKTELLNRKWIWGMDFIFQKYLEIKENT